VSAGRPYLSVVAVSRNDNHGGDLLRRMRIFVSGLLQQADRHGPDCELILVEWNPPADRPPLAEALPWPTKPGRCRVRIITVPAERHRRFRHAEALPLFQMLGKNVGIRRAAAPFVLATNIDLLFNDGLMRFFAAGRLDPARMYRIDRHDASADVPDDEPVDRQLAFCEANLLRVNTRFGTRNLRTGRLTGVHGRLGGPLTRLADAVTERLSPGLVARPLALHTNACGDFTLMSAERWAAVRGYPEMPVFSMQLDSLLCYQAHHAGTTETMLGGPMRAYHVEHASGSGFTPEGAAALYERIDRAGIVRVGSGLLYDWALHMRRTGRPIVFNEADWGLADEEFPETRPVEARP
jgi:hypothetical protein